MQISIGHKLADMVVAEYDCAFTDVFMWYIRILCRVEAFVQYLFEAQLPGTPDGVKPRLQAALVRMRALSRGRMRRQLLEFVLQAEAEKDRIQATRFHAHLSMLYGSVGSNEMDDEGVGSLLASAGYVLCVAAAAAAHLGFALMHGP